MKAEKYLSQKGIVYHAPSLDEIKKRKKVNILYGETYDDFGMTIDSIKYYLFIAGLTDVLESEGVSVNPMILIADTATCRNAPASEHKKIMMQGKQRVEFIKKFNKIYNSKLNAVLMSEYIEKLDFKKIYDSIYNFCNSDKELRNLLERTVPERKLNIEKEKGFQYSIDEITTLFYLDLDIKVGPPREEVYDSIARLFSEKTGKKIVMPLYLTQTYPLAMSLSFFIKNPEIDKYGVTAYKAGSKGLNDNRITLNTKKDKIKELIQQSSVPKKPRLPNPILDICLICELAKQKLENKLVELELYDKFYNGDISPEKLKDMVLKNLFKNIIEKF
ncbi:MAG: hypothetical protein PHW96_03890 [Candidatus Nanoarchaeia archaeon]|nr:hypothetical protein [Candidatus Nanoarchaeia archaeon]